MHIENELTAASLHPAVREFQPATGIVLGSGLGPLVDLLDVKETIPYADIAGLPVSTVPGHSGQFVLGTLGNARLLVAQGRVHLYEGHSARVATGLIRYMAASGIDRLLLTNAAGCANPEFQVGSWMQIADHINFTGQSPLTGGPNFVDMTNIYCRALIEKFSHAAARRDIRLFEGVYAAVPGPQYETPAEVRMLRTLGADAIGMSTVPEAIMGRALGLEVAGFSCLTNWAAGLGHEALHHAEVVEVGKLAASRLLELLAEVLPTL